MSVEKSNSVVHGLAILIASMASCTFSFSDAVASEADGSAAKQAEHIYELSGVRGGFDPRGGRAAGGAGRTTNRATAGT